MKYALFSCIILFGLLHRSEASEVSPLSSADASEFTHRLCAKLRTAIIKLNMDPLVIPTMSTNFSFDFLGHHDGSITMQNIYLLGLSTICREGNTSLDYNLKIATVRVEVLLPEALLSAHYNMTVLGLNPTGDLTARIVNQKVSMWLLVDMFETTGELQHFEFPDSGEMHLSVDGLGLLGNAAANAVIAVLVNVFKENVLGTMAEVMQTAVNDYLTALGPLLPHVPTY